MAGSCVYLFFVINYECGDRSMNTDSQLGNEQGPVWPSVPSVRSRRLSHRAWTDSTRRLSHSCRSDEDRTVISVRPERPPVMFIIPYRGFMVFNCVSVTARTIFGSLSLYFRYNSAASLIKNAKAIGWRLPIRGMSAVGVNLDKNGRGWPYKGNERFDILSVRKKGKTTTVHQWKRRRDLA
ncbi:hypothetical protein GWI33_016688 [Rhynchophorus ferrugineus]|uniref:Uncharacterized protein n=1 Tax=Rhynchophorus ferrugineus TaxID=354439 RepID=A0A834HWY8_RHYFE|nr:hypothetical protein GWI33_016688 [Rhynchophorus ferrugineus]